MNMNGRELCPKALLAFFFGNFFEITLLLLKNHGGTEGYLRSLNCSYGFRTRMAQIRAAQIFADFNRGDLRFKIRLVSLSYAYLPFHRTHQALCLFLAEAFF